MAKREAETRQDGGTGLGRREVLTLAAAGGAAAAIAGALPRKARAQTACSGLDANEKYPVSPLLLKPFTDPLPVPSALRPTDPAVVAGWASQPGPGIGQQDADGGTHQLYPGQAGTICAGMPAPEVHLMKMQVNAHAYTASPVRTLVPFRNGVGRRVAAGTVVPALPRTTTYGFNGTFYTTLINAEYGKPKLLRFQNLLDQNPQNLERGDYGSPEFGFLCHLHNGHTAAESDGNPHHKMPGWLPGGWYDALYLNTTPGGDDAEKMSSLWFHDHFEGHTGANVYKGMAGLYPLYDPGVDDGREATSALHLPGVRTDHADGSFDVAYDHYLALHDVAIDDGAVAHQDFHNGCGESRPDLFGRAYFRHFPNHGFVGDVFCVNGKACPVVTVRRRKYRLRFLGASISRIWEMSFMTSASGPRSALSLGYGGAELQGQYRLTDARLAMDFAHVGNGGGLFASVRRAQSVEVWPAGRPQVVIDFTRYLDGRPTRKGDVIWLVNRLKMLDGRKPDAGTRYGDDPAYRVPVLKIVIGDDAPDQSVMPADGARLRPRPALPGAAVMATLPRRTFELQRGGFGGEIQWLINGHPFDPAVPLATVTQGQPEIWTIRNGGGGWAHPMHLHQEEHQIISRDGVPLAQLPGRDDDAGKDDVINLDGGEEVEIYRNFRTFTGRYVAHCHNLAHEDHAMMFGWVIAR